VAPVGRAGRGQGRGAVQPHPAGGADGLVGADQRAERRGGRPPVFDPDLYAGRNVVERCFNRLKQFRALATCYAKRAAYYRAEIICVAIVLWLRTDLQDTTWALLQDGRRDVGVEDERAHAMPARREA
jgi:hypothetical protein